ncbi:MAG: AMP-binding protein [Acidobacteriota bacterium]
MGKDASLENDTDTEAVGGRRLDRLRGLVGKLLEGNAFWAPRLRAAGLDEGVESFEAFSSALSTLSKEEIAEDQRRHPPYGSNLTYPPERFIRLHQTSGTSGTAPLRWLDTRESWAAMLGTWRRVFSSCGVGPEDRVFFPFSFGPFLGFWTAFEAACEIGCLALPGGGLSSRGRLDMLLDNDATVVCCTPTYALRLGEIAAAAGLDLGRGGGPRTLIVAGEPGGSVPAVRQRIAEQWAGAAVFDHHGMTEVGPVSYPDKDAPGVLRIDGASFHAEVLDLETGRALGAEAGGVGELVLTTLSRTGTPLLRYRTGDVVRPLPAPPDRPGDVGLEGGLLSRVDDMVVVRGVNLYPSAFDRVIRGFAEVAEYRVELRRHRSMAEVAVELEPAPGAAADLPARVADALRATFNLRIPVAAVAAGSLPRFELKAQRWHLSGR